MNIRTQQIVDCYLGVVLLLLLRPLVIAAGWLLKRDHSLDTVRSFHIIKIRGGGSLLLSYPALLGLRRKYPDLPFVLITSPQVKPFADLLGIFTEVIIIENSSLSALVVSGFTALKQVLRADTFIDFEVYSRLTTVFALLSLARNRVSFYLEDTFWRRGISSHLVYFNRFSNCCLFYDQISRLFFSSPAQPDLCRRNLEQQLGCSAEHHASPAVAIAPGCSDFGEERRLSPEQWKEVLSPNFSAKPLVQLHFLGVAAEANLAEEIIRRLPLPLQEQSFNHCGKLSLIDSLRLLASCGEFVGVDSALLHFARMLQIPTTSYWGPTAPHTRLRPVPGLKETVHYASLPCSPCIHVAEHPPCRGRNICIEACLTHDSDVFFRDYENTIWFPPDRSRRSL